VIEPGAPEPLVTVIRKMTRRQSIVVWASIAGAVLVITFPPRLGRTHNFYPIWYGGIVDLPSLAVELWCVGVVEWTVYRRVSGSVAPTKMTWKHAVVFLVALVVLLAGGVVFVDLMSPDLIR
jgi:hypothetical protein